MSIRQFLTMTLVCSWFCFITLGCGQRQDDSDGLVHNVPQDFETIQQAMEAAEDGDTIVLAAGEYEEIVDFGQKSVTIRGEDPKDPAVVASTILLGNSQVVLFAGGEGTLSGVTVRGGSTGSDGAGIHVGSGSSVTIERSVVEGNEAARFGGGVFLEEGAFVELLDNVFENNSASSGGAVYLSGETSSAHLEGNTFTGNEASDGSVIYARRGAAVVIRDNVVTGNAGRGGLIVLLEESTGEITNNEINDNDVALGGPIAVRSGSSARIEENEFIDNVAQGDYTGGAITVEGDSEAFIEKNVISGNSATWGGGVVVMSSVVDIAGNTITENDGGVFGGAILVRGESVVSIKGNAIERNLVTDSGGGIYITSAGNAVVEIRDNEISDNVTGLYHGGGISVFTGTGLSLTIADNDISGNSAGLTEEHQGRGGGVYLGAGGTRFFGNTMSGNEAYQWGGGVFVDDDAELRDGEGVELPRVNSPPGTMPENTFSENTHGDDQFGGADVFFRESAR